jgi:putative copper export protein
LYAGALVTIGDVCARWISSGDFNDRLTAPFTAVVRGAWLAVVVAAAALVIVQSRALELPLTVAALAPVVRGTAWGNAWGLLAVVGLAGFSSAVARASLAVRIAIVIALAVAMSGFGHAAAAEQAPMRARALDAVHVLGMGAWIGTLLMTRRNATREEWRFTSRLCFGAVIAVVITGVAASWRLVGAASPAAIMQSEYGRLLIAKLVLVAVIVAFGALRRRQLERRDAPGSATLRAELWVAAAVLAVTSVLTGSEPPTP